MLRVTHESRRGGASCLQKGAVLTCKHSAKVLGWCALASLGMECGEIQSRCTTSSPP